MRLYKLTDSNDQTRNATQWGVGVTQRTDGAGALCGPGWLHAYEHPLLAVLLNPIHANFDPGAMHLWAADAAGGVLRDGPLKIGVTELTTAVKMPLPIVSTEQRVRFAILCALEVCADTAWRQWAERWLSGEDRSSVWAAEEAAVWAAEAAALAAREARAAAAEAAREARAAAAEAAWAAEAENAAAPAAAALAEAWAAEAAEARAAAWAAAAWAAEAAEAASPIDLIALAARSCQ